MKTYYGFRVDGVAVIQKATAAQSRRYDLGKRLDLWNHSPAGFEWGYGGSGPAQTALALLADALGDDEKAVRLHQKFKFEKVAGLPHNDWTMTDEEIKAWADAQEKTCETTNSTP